MFRKSIVRLVPGIVSASLVLSACGGGGGGHAVPVTVPTAASSGSPSTSQGAIKSGFAYGAKTLSAAAPGGAVKLGTMHVDVALQLADAAGLQAYARAANTPGSPQYRQFLTPSQIASRFGATPANQAAVAAYFTSFGIKAGVWPQRLAVSLSGPQSAFESAFQTKFGKFTTANGVIYGPMSAPSFSVPLPVAAATLISGKALASRDNIEVQAPHGSGQNIALGYAPQQIAAAFDYNGAYAAGFKGDGITIGIIGTGPIDVDTPTHTGDYGFYKSYFGVQGTGSVSIVAATSTAAAAAGGSPTASPPPVTAPCSGSLPTCNPEDGEAQIDTEQATALGRDAKTLFYLAYVPDECGGPTPPCSGNDYGPQEGLAESDDEIQQAIADNTADVISMSYGGPEVAEGPYYFLDQNNMYTAQGFGPLEFAALSAEGIASFASSGDAGAEECARAQIPGATDSLCVSYPATDQNVVSLGGVTTPLNNAGQFVGPVTGWGQQTNNGGLFGASTGGISAYIPAPTWQLGIISGNTYRLQPDLSLEGDSATGVATIANANFQFALSGAYGGTSVAAPEMAAMWALVLSACRQTTSCAVASGGHPYRLGNPAPLLYKIYGNGSGPLYGSTFYDVQFGNNGVVGCFQDSDSGASPCPSPYPTADPGYNAGVGYDLITGLGVPFARHLITAVVGV